MGCCLLSLFSYRQVQKPPYNKDNSDSPTFLKQLSANILGLVGTKEQKMKRSSFILSLLFGLFVTTSILTACSSDDEESGNSLVGTWIVKSISEEDDLEFTSITFKSNGNVEYPGMESDYYMKWTTTGNTLRIDMGEGHPR